MHRLAAIVRTEAEVIAVIEFRRVDDLAGIEQTLGIEERLHFLERAHQPLAEHELVKFRAHDAVAMFAGMRALVVAHHREGFLGDGAHRLDVLVEPQIEHRTHVQAAGAGMRIPGAARAVLFEDFTEPRGVLREMLERHRAILHEGNRFALVLHRHHDVEAGGAHIGDRGLQRWVEYLHHAALLCTALVEAVAEVAHQFGELFQPAQVFVLIILTEFHQQDRVRIAVHEPLQRRAKHRNLTRKLDHGAVDQLDADRLQPDDVLGRIHRVVKAAEVAGADGAASEQGRELQLYPGGETERALRADKNVSEVEVIAAGQQRIHIVAADPALHFREARHDFVGFSAPSASRSLARLNIAELDRNSARSREAGPRTSRLPSARMASTEMTFSRVLP